METKVIKASPQEGAAEAIRAAADVLQAGGLVAFPTETVYGVAVRADLPESMDRLRRVKARQAEKAFTVHIGAREDAARFVNVMPGVAARFVRKAWPGPLTLVLGVDDPASTPVMKGLNVSAMSAMFYENSVGLRCPDDVIAQGVLRAVSSPVVAASANLAGNPPPWTGDDVLRELDGQIDLLIAAGRTKYARPSTIVRVEGSTWEVVREGVYDFGSINRLSSVRLLFVCTGNTCRSPMAEGMARKTIAERLGCHESDLTSLGVLVSSAGLAGGMGSAADHARTVMARRQVDLSGHVSQMLTADMIQQADYIFTMTRSHRDQVVDMVASSASRVLPLLEDQDVQDPLGGSLEDYEAAAQSIEAGLRQRLKEVVL